MLRFMTACLSSCKIGMLAFLVLNEIEQLYAGLMINLNSSECGMNYSLAFHKTAEIEHLGSNILQDDRCSVEFSKVEFSHEQYICVSGQKIELDCGTKLEYHASFIKDYLNPEVEMSCGNETLEEWCPGTYQDNIFIVIRKSPQLTSDVIRLKVYLKDAPDPSYKRTIMMYTIVPLVCIVVLAMTFLYVKLKICKKSQRYTQSNYHVTSGTGFSDNSYTINSTSDHNSYETTPGYQYTPQADHTGQQGQQHTVGSHGNYNVHPMQTAYPMGGEPAPGSQPLLSENVSPLDINAAPPPSYESVVGAKR